MAREATQDEGVDATEDSRVEAFLLMAAVAVESAGAGASAAGRQENSEQAVRIRER